MMKRNYLKRRHELEGSSAKSLPRARGKRLFGSQVRIIGGTRTGGSQVQVYPLWVWMFRVRLRVLVQAVLPLKVLVSPVCLNWVLVSFVETWGTSKSLAHCGLSYVHSLARINAS